MNLLRPLLLFLFPATLFASTPPLLPKEASSPPATCHKSHDLHPTQPNVCTKPDYDPTTPISADTTATDMNNEDLSLQAIFFTPEHPSAIINGTQVEINQMINHYQVLSISKENVQLKGENGIVILPLTQTLSTNLPNKSGELSRTDS
ncbi:MAG: hypothetical protein HY939_04030 [Gammaproteobacteria bacterium]|nr:hypothetical protein [Gammaproteobacteria bacterium]